VFQLKDNREEIRGEGNSLADDVHADSSVDPEGRIYLVQVVS